MPSDIAGLRRDRAKASGRMSELATAARGRSMTDDEQRDFDATAAQVTRLDEQITAAEAEAQRTTTSSTAIQRSEASDIAKACVDGGVPAMASSLLAEGVTLAVAKERIGSASQIKELVALASKTSSAVTADMADQFISAGKTVEQVRAELFDKLVAKQDETAIRSHVGSAKNEGGPEAAQSNMKRLLAQSGMTTKEA